MPPAALVHTVCYHTGMVRHISYLVPVCTFVWQASNRKRQVPAKSQGGMLNHSKISFPPPSSLPPQALQYLYLIVSLRLAQGALGSSCQLQISASNTKSKTS